MASLEKYQKIFKQHKKRILFITLIVVILFDFLNGDRYTHYYICRLFSFIFNLTCTNYYDIKILDFATAIGTIGAAYFAFHGLDQTNRIEQNSFLPVLRFVESDKVIHTGSGNGGVTIENIGKGLAKNTNVYITLRIRRHS